MILTIDGWGEPQAHDLFEPTQELCELAFDKEGTIIRFRDGRFQVAQLHKWVSPGNWVTTSPWQWHWEDIDQKEKQG